jgi:transcriptional regulator with XRE-family HTH domain
MDTSAGNYLKQVRLRLRLGLVDIQHISSKIAARERNRRFYVSKARLNQIESDQYVPTQFKLFTLAAIYGISFHEILRLFGVDTDRFHKYRSQLKLAATRPIASELYNPDTTITVPLRLDPSFKWERTQLINRAVAIWGDIPAAFLLDCNPRQHMYAYIGSEDNTMSPLLRPGALVMVDETKRNVSNMQWSSELERPIYFVEIRDGYLCSWCEVSDSTLTVIPHPTSGVRVKSFSLSTEAEVIGQVVSVAMRLVPPIPSSRGHVAAPPTRF